MSFWLSLIGYASDVSVTDSIAMFDGDKYGDSLDKITDITVMAGLGQQYRLWSGIALLLLYARCIKIFSFHPKLNIIGRMLSVAAGNIGYFGIVFLFLYLGFAYMGHVAFGHTAGSFQSSTNAMHTLFMMMPVNNFSAAHWLCCCAMLAMLALHSCGLTGC